MKLFSRLFNGNAPTFYVSLPTLQTTTCHRCQEKNHKQETRNAGHEEIKVYSPLKTRSRNAECVLWLFSGEVVAWSPAKHSQSLIFVALYYNQQSPPTIVILLLTLTTRLSLPSTHHTKQQWEQSLVNEHPIEQIEHCIKGDCGTSTLSLKLKTVHLFLIVYPGTFSLRRHHWRFSVHWYFPLPTAWPVSALWRIIRLRPALRLGKLCPRYPAEIWRH